MGDFSFDDFLPPAPEEGPEQDSRVMGAREAAEALVGMLAGAGGEGPSQPEDKGAGLNLSADAQRAAMFTMRDALVQRRLIDRDQEIPERMLMALVAAADADGIILTERQHLFAWLASLETRANPKQRSVASLVDWTNDRRDLARVRP